MTTPFSWTLAARAAKMNPSAIREILKLTERPGTIGLAGGLPSPQTFPLKEFTQACNTVMERDGAAALQYAASEGFGPLRRTVADMLPWNVDPDQVLITTGSQQALDLIGKVLLDKDSRMLVETPTYLGALQAFAPQEPVAVGVASDGDGILVEDFVAQAGSGANKARLAYVQPNFQNPTGRTMTEERRAALVEQAAALGIPLIEDNPYGELWFGTPPPAPLTARNPEGCIYMGSFSKVLAPGLRVGFLVAPQAVYPKLLQAKQAADLHTPGFNQRVVHEVIRDGFLDTHVPQIRAMYRRQRDALCEALREHLPAGSEWQPPSGGMFCWVRLPEGCDATALLPQAVEQGIAFVPGAAFYARQPDARTVRLSFVTLTPDEIRTAVATLGALLRRHLTEDAPTPTP